MPTEITDANSLFAVGSPVASNPDALPEKDAAADPNSVPKSAVSAKPVENSRPSPKTDEAATDTETDALSDTAATETASADPNESFDDTGEDDAFSPRLSTLLKITEAYDHIFTPTLISDKGLVDYSTLRRKRQDLVGAMSGLKNLNPAVLMMMSREEKIAFWINTYNACMLNLVIEHYPIEPRIYMIFYPDNSIMQISGNWRTKFFFEIQGLEYNLQEIEEDFLTNRYEDPRILFALSYASRGGAILRNEPYTAEKLDTQLNDQVKRYLESPEGMRIDREDNILYLSNLFTMHQHRELFLESKYARIKKFRDRPSDEQAWLNFIWQYLPEADKQYLELNSFDIKFIKYDWHLNEA